MSGCGQLEKNNVDESLDEVDRQTDRRFRNNECCASKTNDPEHSVIELKGTGGSTGSQHTRHSPATQTRRTLGIARG